MEHICNWCADSYAIVPDAETLIKADYNEFKKLMMPPHRMCLELSEKYGMCVMVPTNAENPCFKEKKGSD